MAELTANTSHAYTAEHQRAGIEGMPSELEHPTVDVVIATHNRPQQLREALEAVINQDYPGRLNTIIVFDQSPPDLSLQRSRGQRTVEVTVNDKRTPGLAGARNSGIEHGSAPLVAFCDDDDIWSPTKIRAQVAALRAMPGAQTCVTGIVVSYGDHEVERVPNAETVTLTNLVRNRGMEAHPSSVIVRRSALEGAIGLVDEAIPGSYGEDFDWILRAAVVAPIAVVSEPLVRVMWGQSLFSSRWQTIVDAIDYLIEKHPEFERDSRAIARLRARQSFALASLGNRREALAHARSAVRANWRERRAYLAVAVASGLVSSQRLMDIAHRRGHGI